MGTRRPRKSVPHCGDLGLVSSEVFAQFLCADGSSLSKVGKLLPKVGLRRQKMDVIFWFTKVFHIVSKSLHSTPKGETKRFS